MLLGALGWFATSFFAKPLLEFINLKSEVLEEMIFSANIDALSEGLPIYKTAVESLRRLGAKVLATDVTAPWLLRKFLDLWGYDLHTAGSNLIGLSNSLNVKGRYLHADKIETSLLLPLTSSDEFIDTIKRQIQQDRGL
ncbi:MAG: hypothetical protein FWC84_00130 [Alphaproteobacteria bacterium]|nr:hypothetical protein [Alphaproteobacteria bacterium]